MKKAIFGVIGVCAYLFPLQAQVLYGTTSKGGTEGGGTIHQFSTGSNALKVVQSFETAAAAPYSGLVQASDGKLYGMTSNGGSNGSGAIFSYDVASATYTLHMSFEHAQGEYPFGNLIQANDGKLYGMTSAGGSSGAGVIFSYEITSGNYKKIMDFNKINGAGPRGDLLQAKDGKLYGMTYFGGSTDEGVMFSYDPVSSTYKKLKDFDYYSAYPAGNLIQASDGKLYGLTSSFGNNYNYGIIFSFDLSTATYTKLKDFDKDNGSFPFGSLIEAKDGKLYGMTSEGGESNAGAIFSFDPASANYTKIHDFDYSDQGNGSHPFGSLVQAKDGKLYGLTLYGGSYSGGVIFSFHPSTFTYKRLKIFEGIIGLHPTGSLIQANDGNFYGVANEGGKIDLGVIFTYNTASASYTKLEDFGTNKTGYDLYSGLTKAADGKLYGVTFSGGSDGFGVIFSFDPVSLTYKKLKDFDGLTGGHPFGSLVQAGNGKLYGMTNSGGAGGWGSIFSFDPATSSYAKLYDFDYVNGVRPFASLVEANGGKLYGTTSSGGSNNAGVIFSFDPSTLIYKKLHNFKYVNGESPSSLIRASNGKLYGTTSAGGKNKAGVMFSFDPLSSTFSKLMDFDGVDGARPLGSLVQAGNGKLYGTTFDGGSNNAGLIFSFDPVSGVYTNLKNFNYDTGGSNPYGSLMEASDGRLYGVTAYGGSNDLGVIYSYNPTASVYEELKSYDGASGAYPGNDFVFVELPQSPPAVNLVIPANNATYLSGGNVYFTAHASDSDGIVNKVEFYHGTMLLHTATDTPYTYKWQQVNLGRYALTAKATDNSGLVTISDTVQISVVANKPPTVRIINPVNDSTFLSGATLQLEAAAQDADGRITKVDFYNGTSLLNKESERKLPYTFTWQNVPAGVYTIRAIAMDNWGAVTSSASVTVTVTPANEFVDRRPLTAPGENLLQSAISLKLAPNPAKNIINVYITGIKNFKQSMLSLVSASGVTRKAQKLSNLKQTIQLDVSSLASGVYILRLTNSEKNIYGKFVKL